MKILDDAHLRPDLFTWNGAIPENLLSDWLRVNGLTPPWELVELWMETGGGDLFETETILGPFAPEGTADDVLSTNQFHNSRRLPDELVLFHIGFCGLTGYNTYTNHILVVNHKSYEDEAGFESLEDWYCRSIRTEYARRYRLPP